MYFFDADDVYGDGDGDDDDDDGDGYSDGDDDDDHHHRYRIWHGDGSFATNYQYNIKHD